MQLPVRHLDTTQVLDFLNHLLFKNIKTELGIDPSELIVAHLFDELNWVNTFPPFYPVTETETQVSFLCQMWNLTEQKFTFLQ